MTVILIGLGIAVIFVWKKVVKIWILFIMICRIYNQTPKSVIKDNIRVTPAPEGKVKLQLYSVSKKAWKTKATFTADAKGKVQLVYPNQWKKMNFSDWRVVVTNQSGKSIYVSDTVQITSRNRKELNLKSKSAIIMDAETGQIYYGKSMDTKRANASTTKMMTAIVALENKKLNSTVKITKEPKIYGVLYRSIARKHKRDLRRENRDNRRCGLLFCRGL